MILAAIFLSISISFLVLFLARHFGPEGDLQRQRSFRERIVQSSTLSAGVISSDLLRKKDNLSELEVLKKFLALYSLSKETALLLRTLKLKISVSVFFLASLLLFIISFLTFKMTLSPVIAFVGAGFIGALPFFCLKILRMRYLTKFSEYLPNAISIISSSIKVGHGLEPAIEAVAKTAPYPVNEEFRTVIGEIKLGSTLPDALKNLYQRIKTNELKIFMTSISIHQDLGGNLSEILGNLEKTIRERLALLREIDTLSAQGRFSSWVLLSMPIFLVGLYLWRTHDLFLQFASSGYGHAVIWICLALQIAGFIGIRQVITLRD